MRERAPARGSVWAQAPPEAQVPANAHTCTHTPSHTYTPDIQTHRPRTHPPHTHHVHAHLTHTQTLHRCPHHVHTPAHHVHMYIPTPTPYTHPQHIQSPKSSTWAPTHRRCPLHTARGLPPLPPQIQFPHVCTPRSPRLPCLLQGSGVKGHRREGKLRGRGGGTDPLAAPLPGQAGQQGCPSSRGQGSLMGRPLLQLQGPLPPGTPGPLPGHAVVWLWAVVSPGRVATDPNLPRPFRQPLCDGPGCAPPDPSLHGSDSGGSHRAPNTPLRTTDGRGGKPSPYPWATLSRGTVLPSVSWVSLQGRRRSVTSGSREWMGATEHQLRAGSRKATWTQVLLNSFNSTRPQRPETAAPTTASIQRLCS